MLKYHSDSPRLLQDLAALTCDDSPAESIAYGKEALKYIDVYPSDSWYGLWTHPEDIHWNLGIAYQKVGDYKSALVHLKTTQNLIAANPGRSDWVSPDLVPSHIAAIRRGVPVYGPPSPEVGMPDVLLPDLPLPDDFDVSSDFFVDELPGAATDNTFDSWDSPDAPISIPDPSAHDPHAVAVQAAHEAFVREQQAFDDFLQWMETTENTPSSQDLDDFLMREMATQLQGGTPAFPPDRLIRAFETFQHHGNADGIKQLQKMDPDIAKAMTQQRPRGKSK